MQPSELVRRISVDNPELLKFQERRVKKGISPLDKGDPGFPTPEHICDAAREAMREGYTHYIMGAGDRELVAAICEKL